MSEKQKFNFLANANPKQPDAPDALAESGSKPSAGREPESTVSRQIQRLEQEPEENFTRFILRSKLRTNRKNNFDMVDIESLEGSILEFGLFQNIMVVYSVEEDMYIIESGHRRTMALDSLIEKWDSYNGGPGSPGYDDYLLYLKNVALYKKGYPCKIAGTIGENILYDACADDSLPDDVIDSEIRLIVSNEEVRSISPEIRRRDVDRLDYLFGLKNKGKPKQERLNANKTIGSLLHMSERQVNNYKAVGRLIPELREEFDRKNITLKEGSNYSRLSEEEQHTILSMLRAGEKVSASEIDTLLKEKKGLSEKIEEQQRTIQMLEETAVCSGNETGLLEKDTEIASLKKEIMKLKEKEKKLTKRQPFNPNQALLAKQDLTVRNAYGTCRKDIRCLLSEMDSLRKLAGDSNPDEICGLGILGENDMLDFIGELKNLLGGNMNETDS